MTEKPAGVNPLCAILLSLGVLGLLGGLVGIASQFFQPKQTAPHRDPKLAEVNAEYETRMAGVLKDTLRIARIVLPFSILSSGLLVAAGISGLKLCGLGLLRCALVVSVVADLAAMAAGTLAQVKTMAVFRWYFQASSGVIPLPPGFDVGMQFAVYTGMFFGAGWFVVKMGCYVWGLIYLGKPAVRAAFAGSSAGQAGINP
jgi:hypothetical protein